jgi:hypothetical protein
MVQQMGGWSAFKETISLLAIHGLILLAVTLLAALCAWLSIDKNRPKYFELVLYCGAFSMFGVATAYFLSLGLSAASDSGNTMVASFVTPFVSLLTGGVAFAAAKSRAQVTSNELVLGVACFLLSCILSYQTFSGQITGGVGDLPTATGISAPGGPRTLTPPSDGNAQSAGGAGKAPSDARRLPPPSDGNQLESGTPSAPSDARRLPPPE